MAKKKIPKIIAPSKLCLYDVVARPKTVKFVASLYQYEEKQLEIDFSETVEITGAAAVFLFAHITSIQLHKKNAGYFVFNCKNSPAYRSYFLQKGLLRALRAGSVEKLNQLGNDCLFQSGTVEQLSEKRAFILQLLRHFLEQHLPSEEAVKSIYPKLQMSISEMLINIVNHAYYEVDAEKRWWQLMWYNTEKRQFTLFLYDLGVGIETSYKEHSTEKQPEPIFLQSDELYYFRQALSSGKSRFVGNGRGFGLARIIDLVENNPYMNMLLFSTHFAYDKTHPKKMKYQLNDVFIPGTLFELTYVLPNGDNNERNNY